MSIVFPIKAVGFHSQCYAECEDPNICPKYPYGFWDELSQAPEIYQLYTLHFRVGLRQQNDYLSDILWSVLLLPRHVRVKEFPEQMVEVQRNHAIAVQSASFLHTNG